MTTARFVVSKSVTDGDFFLIGSMKIWIRTIKDTVSSRKKKKKHMYDEDERKEGASS